LWRNRWPMDHLIHGYGARCCGRHHYVRKIITQSRLLSPRPELADARLLIEQSARA
jgi:hypothetical protein